MKLKDALDILAILERSFARDHAYADAAANINGEKCLMLTAESVKKNATDCLEHIARLRDGLVADQEASLEKPEPALVPTCPECGRVTAMKKNTRPAFGYPGGVPPLTQKIPPDRPSCPECGQVLAA